MKVSLAAVPPLGARAKRINRRYLGATKSREEVSSRGCRLHWRALRVSCRAWQFRAPRDIYLQRESSARYAFFFPRRVSNASARLAGIRLRKLFAREKHCCGSKEAFDVRETVLTFRPLRGGFSRLFAARVLWRLTNVHHLECGCLFSS